MFCISSPAQPSQPSPAQPSNNAVPHFQHPAALGIVTLELIHGWCGWWATVAGGSLTIWRNDGYMLHDGWFVGDVEGEAAPVPPTHCCHGELIARQHGSGASRTPSHVYLRLYQRV